MIENLQNLKDFFGVNTIKGIDPLSATSPVLDAEGSFHGLSLCHRLGGEVKVLSLRELFEKKPDHVCLNSTTFEYDGDFLHLEDILAASKEILELPHWDSIKSFTTLKEVEVFDRVIIPFLAKFSYFANDSASPTVMNWMHHNKGYPLDCVEIFETFKSQISRTLEQLLAPSILKVLDPNSNGGMLKETTQSKKLREIYDQEMAAEERIICLKHTLPSKDFTLNAPVHLVVLTLALESLNPGSNRVVILPPSLVYVFTQVGAIMPSTLRVHKAPSAEELSTVEMLVQKGFSLEEAVKSMTKL